MDLSVLPDERATHDPLGQAVADDISDLNNAEFLDAVKRAAATLRSRGVSAGDVVAIKLPNTVEFVVSLFAAWRLGAAVTPVNPALSPQEVRYQLADAGAKVLIADELHQCEPAPADASRGNDASLALLIYTSGTTGRPKGVMLDHANLNAMCRSVIEGFRLTRDDHSLLILPLFHVNGIVVGTLSPLLAGGRATVAGRFDPKTFFAALEQSRATYFSAVPTIYTMLCGLPDDVATGHVIGAVRGLRGCAGQRRAAGTIRIALRHPDHRGLRAVGGNMRQCGQPAERSPQTGDSRTCRCPGRPSGSSTRQAARSPTVRPARLSSRAPT